MRTTYQKAAISLAVIVLVLFAYHYHVRKQWVNCEDHILVTAVDSRSFAHLLPLIDSLKNPHLDVKLIVWDVWMRECQMTYLKLLQKRLPARIEVREFPFWRHPIHLMGDFEAWKAVALKKVVDEYGCAIWIDPGYRIGENIKNCFVSLHHSGFVGSLYHSSQSEVCSSLFVGFKQGSSAYGILQAWARCALNSECIAKRSKYSGGWQDWTLTQEVQKANMKCEPISAVQVSKGEVHTLEKEHSQLIALCQRRASVGIMTGDHTALHWCYKGNLAKLRQNKENYAKTHGYELIFEHKCYRDRKVSGTCHANWGKIDGILKYMEDYDILFYLDDDVVLTNFSTSLTSFFDLPEINGHDIILTVPSGEQMINAGVLLIRNSEKSRRVFKAMYDSSKWSRDWCRRFSYEQALLWEMTKSGSKWNNTVKVLYGNVFQSICGFKDGHCLWGAGDFSAHFCPGQCPLEALERFLKEHANIIHLEE